MVEVKGRKAAFLREAVRVLDLSRALVENVRFQELLERHGQRGTYSALSIRAVRVESAMLREVAEFLAPDGLALLFRGPSGPVELTDADPLAWTGTYPLVDATSSRLSVFAGSSRRMFHVEQVDLERPGVPVYPIQAPQPALFWR